MGEDLKIQDPKRDLTEKNQRLKKKKEKRKPTIMAKFTQCTTCMENMSFARSFVLFLSICALVIPFTLMHVPGAFGEAFHTFWENGGEMITECILVFAEAIVEVEQAEEIADHEIEEHEHEKEMLRNLKNDSNEWQAIP